MTSDIRWTCPKCGETNYSYMNNPTREYKQCRECYEGYTITTDEYGNILYIY